MVEVSSASDGAYTQVALSSANSYAAPQTIATQSYSQSLSYNSWLGVTQMTGLNGEQLYATYDTTGRPITATSPYGVFWWNYSYSTAYTLNPPFWQAKTGPDGYTKTTLDGLGRAIRVERGADSTHIQSVVDTVYTPCACSPLVSIPEGLGSLSIRAECNQLDCIYV